MASSKFAIIKLDKDTGSNVNVLLNNEPLVEGQLIEVKWKNRTTSKHYVELVGSIKSNSCHNDNWTVIHHRPFIEVIHNDTEISVLALGLKARKV